MFLRFIRVKIVTGNVARLFTAEGKTKRKYVVTNVRRTILFSCSVAPTCVSVPMFAVCSTINSVVPVRKHIFRAEVNVWHHYDLIFTQPGSPFLLHLDSNMTLFFLLFPNIYFTCLHHLDSVSLQLSCCCCCSSYTLGPLSPIPHVYAS